MSKIATLTITKGLPASGKSTWAKKTVLASGGNIKRVNKDDLRDMVDAGKWSKNNEKDILQVRDMLVEYYLASGLSVIVDDTNLHPKHEEALREIASKFNAKFVVESFLDVSVAECIRRDLGRTKSVGERVIRSMFSQFLQPVADVYSAPAGKPTAIICDIDGTLAHMAGRSPFEWDKVGSDVLDQVVAGILRRYWTEDPMNDTHEPQIIMLSGRDSVCRAETEKWLHDNGIRYDHLYMRAAGDMRKDNVIKLELFNEHIRDNYDVLFVLDDRNQVVEMWRNQVGLKVLQVAEGDF